MTNLSVKGGFKIASSLDEINGKIRSYFVPSTDGTALFLGDPVILAGSSNASDPFPSAGSGLGNVPGSLPTVTRATAGATNKITGIIVGFKLPAAGSGPFVAPYRPANTAMIVRVIDDPFALFEIQASSDAAVAVTDVGANANLKFTAAGDTTSGFSGCELDTSSMIADATYQLQILGLVNRFDNELGTNAKLLVRINLPSYAFGVAGV